LLYFFVKALCVLICHFFPFGDQQMSNKEQRSNKEARKKPQQSLKEKRAAKKAKKNSH